MTAPGFIRQSGIGTRSTRKGRNGRTMMKHRSSTAWSLRGAAGGAGWPPPAPPPTCSSVNYQLPAPAERDPSRRSVAIAFEDARKTGAFLSPSARDELEGFANVYALTVSKTRPRRRAQGRLSARPAVHGNPALPAGGCRREGAAARRAGRRAAQARC
ncbi:MAG: hypothetical protein MZV70_67265 [Desulfobacterales bacterium]|nr:hypothetical protein [Desulfobacterales bacterium]